MNETPSQKYGRLTEELITINMTITALEVQASKKRKEMEIALMDILNA